MSELELTVGGASLPCLHRRNHAARMPHRSRPLPSGPTRIKPSYSANTKSIFATQTDTAYWFFFCEAHDTCIMIPSVRGRTQAGADAQAALRCVRAVAGLSRSHSAQIHVEYKLIHESLSALMAIGSGAQSALMAIGSGIALCVFFHVWENRCGGVRPTGDATPVLHRQAE